MTEMTHEEIQAALRANSKTDCDAVIVTGSVAANFTIDFGVNGNKTLLSITNSTLKKDVLTVVNDGLGYEAVSYLDAIRDGSVEMLNIRIATVDIDGAITSAAINWRGASYQALVAGAYYFTVDDPGKPAILKINLVPKRKPRQPNRAAVALKALSELLADFEFITDQSGAPVNLAAQNGVYWLRLISEDRVWEAGIVWCRSLRQATAHATLDSGEVLSATIDDPGGHYDWTPKVVFSGGGSGAKQATAEALVFGGGTLAAILITDPGATYTSVPTVAIEGFTPSALTLPSDIVKAFSWDGAVIPLPAVAHTPTDEPVVFFRRRV